MRSLIIISGQSQLIDPPAFLLQRDSASVSSKISIGPVTLHIGCQHTLSLSSRNSPPSGCFRRISHTSTAARFQFRHPHQRIPVSSTTLQAASLHRRQHRLHILAQHLPAASPGSASSSRLCPAAITVNIHPAASVLRCRSSTWSTTCYPRPSFRIRLSFSSVCSNAKEWPVAIGKIIRFRRT